MKISAAIATLAITGRTPGEVDLVDRISQFVTESPHAFLGSGAFLALGRRLAAAGVKPVDGEQVDITPFARSITVAEAKEALKRVAAPNTSSVMDRVLLVVAEQAQLPVGEVTPETVLDKIGFDSLGLVELVLAMEERFEVDIPEDMQDLEAVKTVEDIARIVERVLSQGGAQQVAEYTTVGWAPRAVEHTQLGLPHVDAGPDPDMHNKDYWDQLAAIEEAKDPTVLSFTASEAEALKAVVRLCIHAGINVADLTADDLEHTAIAFIANPENLQRFIAKVVNNL